MSCYSLYLEQYTSSITLAGQITVFQKTQALYYIFFMKWTQDNSPFQWLGQLLFIAGTWKLFQYCLKSEQVEKLEAKAGIFTPDNIFLRVFLMASKPLTYTHSYANI